MFRYHLVLALRSLRRNVVLTALMIAAIAIGISASMTMLTIFRAMAADPIPRKSTQLFVPQLDNRGPGVQSGTNSAGGTSDRLPPQLSYTDAVALMRLHAARRQAAMYTTELSILPSNPQQAPFRASAVATYADFFTMFGVPFEYGAPWNAAADRSRAPLAIITRDLNDRLFGGADSVGSVLRLGTDAYRVVGVIDDWDPAPRFYDIPVIDLSGSRYGDAAQVFLPFTTAVGHHLTGRVTCSPRDHLGSGAATLLRSECIWIQLWVQLPDAAAVRTYRAFLHNYAAEQQRSGRFDWPPHTALRNVRQWLRYRQAVPAEVHLLVAASFGFLFVCLLNAMGVMLAKFMARLGSVGVRRALGADRAAIFWQCLVEAGTVGLASGGAGYLFTLRPDQTRSGTSAAVYFADEQTLHTLDLKLIAGRNFGADDVVDYSGLTDQPATGGVIITRALAVQLAPGGNALGRTVTMLPTRQSAPIVGIIERLQVPWVRLAAGPGAERSALLPYRDIALSSFYVVRARPGQISAVMTAARDKLFTVSRARIIDKVQSLSVARRDAYRGVTALAVMLTLIGIGLLAVTACGIVGLASFWVLQRRRQIGIRRTLGGTRMAIMRYVQMENLLITGAGTGMGVSLAVAINLWMVRTYSMLRLPVEYLIAGAAMMLVLGQLAVLGPAPRAASVPPAVATRAI